MSYSLQPLGLQHARLPVHHQPLEGPLPAGLASVAHGPFPAELEKELSRRPRKVCIVKVVGTRNLWKNIVVLCVNS